RLGRDLEKLSGRQERATINPVKGYFTGTSVNSQRLPQGHRTAVLNPVPGFRVLNDRGLNRANDGKRDRGIRRTVVGELSYARLAVGILVNQLWVPLGGGGPPDATRRSLH